MNIANVNSIPLREDFTGHIWFQKICNKWISRTKGVSIVWHIKRSQDHGVTTWHAKSLPDFDSEFVNTNLIIRLCAYKTCLHAIIKVEMAFFSTFFFAVIEKIVYRIVKHKRKRMTHNIYCQVCMLSKICAITCGSWIKHYRILFYIFKRGCHFHRNVET